LKSLLLLSMPMCQVLFLFQGCSRNPDFGARLHPPTHLESSTSDESVHLSWRATDSTKEAEYNVYHSTRPNGPFEKILTTRATGCTIPIGAKEARVHYFCVTATLNQAAESPCSNQIAAKSPESLSSR
jgi:fibronectin type 3 domain-containing protein